MDSKATPGAVGGPNYQAEIFVAVMGGHFARANVTIDPSSETPIILNEPLGMVGIGSLKTHPAHDIRHDIRIDVNDRNVGFWSTYRPDPNGNLRVGKSDLTTGRVLLDVIVPPDPRITWAGANYCASGQAHDYFMPVFMGQPGFIDVFAKNDLAHQHRVFIGDELGFKPGEYTFAHGSNTPDMKYFLLTLNLTPDGHTKFGGNTQLIMLDMKALEQGKIKKVKEATIYGKPRDATGGHYHLSPAFHSGRQTDIPVGWRPRLHH
ncbi:MAG: hypothetical protein EYX74_06395 [Desulfobulbaceae bacterium]|nr:MAG: hypothetical protein EYX74_06395 [Desulfobulbaceae bacterium]